MNAGFPYVPPFRLGERELALAERLVAAMERLAGLGRADESGRAAGSPTAVSHSAPGARAPAPGQTEPAAAGGSGESGAVRADEAPPTPPPVRRAAWRTPERAAVLRDQWPAGAMVVDVRKALAALPGAALPDNTHIAAWATDLGLRRPDGFRQRMGLRWTPERNALVREMWARGAADAEIAEAVNALPGPPATAHLVGVHGREELRLPSREAVRGPGAVKWTPERAALVRRMWPSDATNQAIAAAVNALPGPPATGFQVGAYGRDALKLPPRRDVRARRPAAPPRQEIRGGSGAGAPAGPRVAPSAPAPGSGRPAAAQARPVPPPAPASPPRDESAVASLPPPGPDGKIYATFAQIRAWAAGRHLEYDGTNVAAVNKLRALMGGAPPVVQVAG